MDKGHEVKELIATAKLLKNQSRIKTGSLEYMLIKFRGGIDVETIDDPSYVGSFWVDGLVYLIFGPTESERLLGGDHQSLVWWYCSKHKKKARVYTLKSQQETIILVQAKIVKKISGNLPEDSELGLVKRKDNEALVLTKKDLSMFAITIKNFLFGY